MRRLSIKIPPMNLNIGSLSEKSADSEGPVMVREHDGNAAADYVQEELFLSAKSARNHRIIGQVFGTYWLVEFEQKLYIIDQHAAHEKVLYERTMKLLKDKEMTTQMVSPPIVVTLSAQEEETLENCRGALEEMGFELSEFGGREYAICGVPGNLFSLDPKQLFLDVLSECSGIKVRESYEMIMERVASMSCKAAVKGNQHLSRPEIEELITERAEINDKESYYNAIIMTMIRINRAGEFIVAISNLIQRLVVDHLHIVGDIYDRGPGPHLIMDRLLNYHSVDIQWGNHDVLWMGAAAGQQACIANVIRICARYGNLDILEDGYGINLLPLATFALRMYKDDPCSCFSLKGPQRSNQAEMETDLRMHRRFL